MCSCLTTLPRIMSTFFFFNDTATTEIYTLSLHDALPIYPTELAGELADVHVHPARLLSSERGERAGVDREHRDAERAAPAHSILTAQTDRKSTRLNSSH